MGIFLYLLLSEVFNLYKSLIAKSWKSATGKIQNWDRPYSDAGDSNNFQINRLRYTYSVSENEYISKRVGFGFPGGINAVYVGGLIKSVLQSAPELKVYYDPSSPDQSTLVVGLRFFHLFKLFLYGFLLVFTYSAVNTS